MGTTNPFMGNANGTGAVNGLPPPNTEAPKMELPPHPHMLPGAPMSMQPKQEMRPSEAVQGDTTATSGISTPTSSDVVRAGESVPNSVSSMATESQILNQEVPNLENGQRLPTVTNVNAGISQEESVVVGASQSTTPSSSV